MPFAYVLFSKSLNRFYIGSTREKVEVRLDHHLNLFYGKKAFTAKAEDWVVFWSMYTDTMEHARKIESKVKKMKSRRYLQNLLKYPDLSTKIYKETS